MRILCVDDDGLIAGITADLLRTLGHDVTEAVGGYQAAAAIERLDAFDMLVTDIHMPGGIDGPMLASFARKDRPDLPVIYFSGVAQITPAGPRDRVLPKPCSLGELDKAISVAAAAPSSSLPRFAAF